MLFVALLATRAEAQTCRGTEVLDRDHPVEVGPLLTFGEDTSSIGGAGFFGNKHEYFGGSLSRSTTGGQLFASATPATLQESVEGGVELSNRRKSISFCPFGELTHVNSINRQPSSTTPGFGAPGSLAFEGGVHVAFGGGHSDELRVVPIVGGGIVHSRTSVPTSPTASKTLSGNNASFNVGLSLIREDSTSFTVSYAFAFNTSQTSSALIIALNFALGHH